VPGWYMHRKNDAGPECSHYCHPSSPQLWVYMLYRTLQEAGVRIFIQLQKQQVRLKIGAV
jgi:hypothetical protein